MGKQIVVLTGSPRKRGNSFAMTQAFIEAAEARGHAVTRFDAAFLEVSGCRGCYGCIKTGVCVLRDDFSAVAEAIQVADTVVFSTPLYYYTFSSQLKTVLDRFVCLHHRRRLGKLAGGKECALLACCADEEADHFDGLLYSYRMSMRELTWNSVGEVLATGIWSTPDQEKLSDACRRAAELAERF